MSLQINYKNSWIKHAAIIAVLSVVYVFNFKNINTLSIFNDEFGYWGNAATLAGIDWTGLLSITPNYNIGYSIVLVPIMRFVDNSALMYELAILLNMCFLAISYFCAFYIYTSLFEDKGIAHIVSGIAALSGFALVQSQIAWTETMLSMVYWLIISLFVSVIKKYSVYKEVLLYVSVFYMLLIHQRTMFSCALVILALFAFLIRKRKFKNIMIACVMGVMSIVLYKYIQSYQSNVIYQASDMANYNTLELSGSVVLDYIKVLISGFQDIMASFTAKLYAVSLMLMGLTFVLIFGCLKRIKHKDKYSYIFALVLSDFLLMLCLSSIRMPGGDRADLIVYTRYMEYTIGPCFLLGMGFFFNHEVERKYGVYNILFCMAVSKYVFLIINQSGHFNVCCSPHIGAFIERAKQSNTSANVNYQAAFYITIVLLLLLYVFYRYRERTVHIFIIFICINVFVFYYGNMQTNTYRENHSIVAPAVDILSEKSVSKVYYLYDEEYFDGSRYAKSLQSRLPNVKIVLIHDLNEINGYVISNCQLDNYEALYEYNNCFCMYYLN